MNAAIDTEVLGVDKITINSSERVKDISGFCHEFSIIDRFFQKLFCASSSNYILMGKNA
jgi:hypothetical protein